LADADGISLAEVLEKFNIALGKAKFIVGQNLGLISILWVVSFIEWGRKPNELDAYSRYVY
jgi:DNA polymerase-3 subunit alpha